jgi:cytochrome d ubiquinol oxidase subunit II
VWEADRLADAPMVEYFRRRAVGAAVVAGVIAFAGLFVLRADAPYLFGGLRTRALPLVVVSAVCGTAALVLLLRANHRGARLAAVGAVAAIIVARSPRSWSSR